MIQIFSVACEARLSPQQCLRLNLRKVETGCCEEEARMRSVELISAYYRVQDCTDCTDMGVEVRGSVLGLCGWNLKAQDESK